MADVIITHSPRTGTALDGAATSPKAHTITHIMREHSWTWNPWTRQWRLPATLETSYPVAAATTAATDLAQAGVTVDVDIEGTPTHLTRVRTGHLTDHDVAAGDWITLTHVTDEPDLVGHLLVEPTTVARPWLKVTRTNPATLELLDLEGHPATVTYRHVHDRYQANTAALAGLG